MIATNILLSAGFSLVASFANTVSLPMEDVPKTTNDLKRITVVPVVPPILSMVTTNGTLFHIQHGVVCLFQERDNFLTATGLQKQHEFSGEPILTTNQVAARTLGVLKRLIKVGNPLENSTVEVTMAGSNVPVYRIEVVNLLRRKNIAEVQIDARSDRILCLNLFDYRFMDPDAELKIVKDVTGEDPEADVFFENDCPAQPTGMPRPRRDYVMVVVRNLAQIISQLNFEPQPNANIDNIEWSRTFLKIDHEFSQEPICQIEFVNGPFVFAADGAIFYLAAKDAAYVGPHRMQKYVALRRFFGPTNTDWTKLAHNFERTLIERFQVSPESIDNLELLPPWYPPVPMFEGRPIQRVDIQWLRRISERPQGEPARIRAEFDLATGRTKAFTFTGTNFIQCVARTQESYQEGFPTVNIAPARFLNGVERTNGAFIVSRDARIHEPLTVEYTIQSTNATEIAARGSILIARDSLWTNLIIPSISGTNVSRAKGSTLVTLLPGAPASAGLPAYVIGELSSATN